VTTTGRHGAAAAASVGDLEGAVAAAAGGDERAFREVYHAIQPGLVRYMRVLVGQDAEDVAADAWLAISRDIRSFRGDSAGFRAWAATIARHRAMDHLRRTRRRPPESLPGGVLPEDLAGLAAHDDTEASALDALSTLGIAAFGTIAATVALVRSPVWTTSRVDELEERLQSRTNHPGKPPTGASATVRHFHGPASAGGRPN